MSKYRTLWEYISKYDKDKMILTYEEIDDILGFGIDHSFLTFKKELLEYGFLVGKISMKNQTVEFIKS